MEAGAAAGPAGDAAQGAEAPAEQSPDLAQLVQDATAPLQDRLEEMRSFLEASPALAAQQEQEPEVPAEPDLSYLNPNSPLYDAEQAGAELLRVIGQQQQQSLQPLEQQLKSVTDELNQVKTQGEYERLAGKYADLAEPEVANKVFAAAGEWVGQLGLPADQAERLAQSPRVIEAVYMMGRAAELANEESSAGDPNAATLEGPGGASPQAPVQGGLTAESIVGAGGRSPLPF